MSVPYYQTLIRPLLAYGQDGGEKNIREAIKRDLPSGARRLSERLRVPTNAPPCRAYHWGIVDLDQSQSNGADDWYCDARS
jgi:hypothetical protein